MTLRNDLWRSGYDSWKLASPLEDEEDDEDAREEAEARAENQREAEEMEDHFERKYGHAH